MMNAFLPPSLQSILPTLSIDNIDHTLQLFLWASNLTQANIGKMLSDHWTAREYTQTNGQAGIDYAHKLMILHLHCAAILGDNSEPKDREEIADRVLYFANYLRLAQSIHSSDGVDLLEGGNLLSILHSLQQSHPSQALSTLASRLSDDLELPLPSPPLPPRISSPPGLSTVFTHRLHSPRRDKENIQPNTLDRITPPDNDRRSMLLDILKKTIPPGKDNKQRVNSRVVSIKSSTPVPLVPTRSSAQLVSRHHPQKRAVLKSSLSSALPRIVRNRACPVDVIPPEEYSFPQSPPRSPSPHHLQPEHPQPHLLTPPQISLPPPQPTNAPLLPTLPSSNTAWPGEGILALATPPLSRPYTPSK